MQNDTERAKKKIVPVVIAIVVVLYAAPLIGLTLACIGLEDGPEAGWLTAVLVGYAILGAAVIVGVLAAMRQRLREIDAGEEDEARKF